MYTRLVPTLAASALLVACGSKEEPAAIAAQSAADEPAATAPATPPTQAEPAADEALAAVEESDGSFDAEEVAKEGSLRMAQNNAEAAPQRFKEGVHYKRFRPVKPTIGGGEQIEVAEVFWYGCNHCFNLEPTLDAWSADLPADVNFVKMPAVWNPTVETHAQFFYTVEALAGEGSLKDKDAVHQAFFDTIHVDRKPVYRKEALRAFIEDYDVTAEQFDKAWDSFEVNTRMRQAKSLNRAYNIASVPTLVVNGKYVTDETMAGGKSQLVAVIDELIASER
ncbi:MAG: thiol:disulfide interchange protein DsbA/DsbL [Pseudomonadota bacterium]